MIPVEELKEGDGVTSLYAVRQKETPRDYRNKEGKYFFFTVGDRTGNIKVKFWGGGEPEKTLETYRSINVGSVVEIAGDVEYDRFGEELFIKMSEGLHFIRHCSESEYEPGLFLPTSDKDLGALYKTLLARLDSMESESLKDMLVSFFGDESFAESFRNAPASMMHHHSYVGGLLVHTLGVVGICDRLADTHPEIDRDLLAAAAMLYNIGKTRGYVYTTSIDISDEGQFIGNVAMSYTMVKDRIEGLPDFPKELALKLYHIILTHHGDSEKYSTRRFRIPEACALHHADALDAQVQEFIKERSTQEDGSSWPYSQKLGHALYKGE